MTRMLTLSKIKKKNLFLLFPYDFGIFQTKFGVWHIWNLSGRLLQHGGRNRWAKIVLQILRAYLGLQLSSTTAVCGFSGTCKSERSFMCHDHSPVVSGWATVSLFLSPIVFCVRDFVFIHSSPMICVTGVSSTEFEERDYFLVLIPHLTYTCGEL